MTKTHNISGIADFCFPVVLFEKEHLSKQTNVKIETLEILCEQLSNEKGAKLLVHVIKIEKKDKSPRYIHDSEAFLKEINRKMDHLLKKVRLPECFR